MSIQFRRIWGHDLHQRPHWPSVVLSPDLILLQERSTRLIKLDPTWGHPIWEAKVRQRFGIVKANSKGVFYLNRMGSLQCFSIDSGFPLWEYASYGGNYWDLVATDEFAVTNSVETSIRCFNSLSGITLWQYSQSGSYAYMLAGPWGLLLSDFANNCIQILHWKSGTVYRTIPLPPEASWTGICSPLQLYDDDAFLLTTREGGIYLLYPTQDVGWKKALHHNAGILTARPAILGRQIIFFDNDGCLCSYHLEFGNCIWSCPSLYPSVNFVPAARLPDSTIAIGHQTSGRIEVIDQAGHPVAAATVGQRVTTPLCSVGRNRLLFGTKREVVAYELQP